MGGNLTGNVVGNVTGNVIGSIGSVTAGVTASTNNDKTNYTLSANGLDNITTTGNDTTFTNRCNRSR